MTQFTELTDDQKSLSANNASGLLPSGEGNYFDANAHSVNSRYNRGLAGGLSNQNVYVEKMKDGDSFNSSDPPSNAAFRKTLSPDYDPDVLTRANSHSTAASGLLFNSTPGDTSSVRSRQDGDDERGLVSPNGFQRANFLNVDGGNFLSNYDTSADTTEFNLVNPYIHYMPNPQGGVGLIDKTDFFYNYDPLAGTPRSEKFYKYGEPT